MEKALAGVKVGDMIAVRQASHQNGLPPINYEMQVSAVGRKYITAFRNPEHPDLTIRFDIEWGNAIECWPGARAWRSVEERARFERHVELKEKAGKAVSEARFGRVLERLNDAQLEQLIALLSLGVDG